jgi:putative FmdB family regulatory protein
MPLYDYHCEDCDSTFEVRLSFSEVDTARPVCPDCGSDQVKRRIGNVLMKRGKSANALTLDQLNTAVGYSKTMDGSSGESGPSHRHSHNG